MPAISFVLLLALLFFPHFQSGTANVTSSLANLDKGPSGRHIMWGHGRLQYVVFENRQFFKLDDEGSILHDTGAIYDKSSIKAIFMYYESLKFDKLLVNNQQGFYYIIKCVTTKSSHQVAWSNPDQLGKKYKNKIPDFYKTLMSFVTN